FMSQFCGSGLRSRSNVTSAACASDVLASSTQPSAANGLADFVLVMVASLGISLIAAFRFLADYIAQKAPIHSRMALVLASQGGSRKFRFCRPTAGPP